MFKPLGRFVLLAPCKNPFKVPALDVFAVDCERQKEVGWGKVIAAGPEATAKVDDVLFFANGTEMRIAMDDSLIGLLVDNAQGVGLMEGVEVTVTNHKANKPVRDEDKIVLPEGTPSFLKVP